MPNFDESFKNAKGSPIFFNGLELLRVDRILLKGKISGSLRVLSVNSNWKQAIRIKIDGELTINEVNGNNFVIWANDISESVNFVGEVKKGQFMLWNAWDTGSGRVDAWLNGAAMNVTIDILMKILMILFSN